MNLAAGLSHLNLRSDYANLTQIVCFLQIPAQSEEARGVARIFKKGGEVATAVGSEKGWGDGGVSPPKASGNEEKMSFCGQEMQIFCASVL